MTAPVFLTSDELAKRWRMHVHALSNWRVRGRGPAFVKMGAGRNSRVLYRLDDVEKYEAAGRKETQ